MAKDGPASLESLAATGRALLNASDDASGAHHKFEHWDKEVAEWLDRSFPNTGASAEWSSLPTSRLVIGGHYYDDAPYWLDFRKAVQQRLAFLGQIGTKLNHAKEPAPKDQVANRTSRTVETAFDRYELQRVIGQGGAGQVWQATDASGADVAVKVLKLETANTERRKRFKNEITFCQHIRHRNIVPVFDHGVTKSDNSTVPFFVMPLYASSVRKIAENNVAPDKRLEYFCQILDGVEAAHLSGVTHRDLKPENILYDSSADNVVVADFGIAHFTDEDIYTPVETLPHARLANFLYAAPEQRIRGQATDARTDIYSLGLILNELFTGHVPHGEGYTLVTSKYPAYAWVDAIVAQMIQADSARRPQTIDAVKVLMASTQKEHLVRQRLSEIKKTVVPAGEEDDPLAIDGPRIVDIDIHNGVLKLIFDQPLKEGWIRGLQNMGSHSFLLGKGPTAFEFLGNQAAIRASEPEVQPIVDQFKDWIPKATHAYRNARDTERKRRTEQERTKLQEEQAALELRQRLRRTIRL